MSKNRLFLIIQREYLSIVAKKSFILITLLSPFIILLVGAIPALLSQFNSGDIQTIAVADYSNKYGEALVDNDEYRFVKINQPSEKLREYYNSNDDINAIIVIPENVLTGNNVSVFSDNTLSVAFTSYVKNCLDKELSEAKMQSYDMPDLQKIIDECNVEVNLESIKWNESGDETSSSSEIAMLIGLALSFLTYMFVLMYGAMIMSSVIEEKTNRIVEVIISSCKPVELMLGKIIGVGLVGITQILIWGLILGISSVVLGATLLPEMGDMAATTGSQMPTDGDFIGIIKDLAGINYFKILLCFIIYFIGGYLLYASIFAGLASAVDQASDASQFTSPLMMVVIIALYVGLACMENPNGQLAVWASMIPFTSPIVMMIRLPFDLPIWQLALSMVILFATVAFFIVVSAKIYRTGILLYGKKNSFKDIFRWIK